MDRISKMNALGMLWMCAILALSAITPSQSLANTNDEDHDIWITAYLASWDHYVPPGGNWGVLPTDEIDFDAFSHLIYFALSAYEDGSVSEVAEYENMNPDRLESIVPASHENDTPIIISVGGWGNYDGFSSAIREENRTNFVNNLIDFIEEWGFDGIDLDMEPIQDSDVDNFKAFVEELHDALEDVTTPYTKEPLLVAATDMQAGMWADIQEYFDQINVMTYDFSGAWEGWVTWHNSNIWSGGHTFPGDEDRELPSMDGDAQEFLDAGVEPEKLGTGLDFYGYRWTGVSEPLESWDSAPDVEDNIAYYELAEEYGIESEENPGDYYEWDDEAGAAYLSIDDPDNFSDPKFISYDNERTAREKIQYARDHDLGGMIIWELAGGYQQDNPAGERDFLLQSVKEAWLGDEDDQPITLESPDILYPESDADEIPTETEVEWTDIDDAASYDFQLATNSSLSAVEIDTTVSDTSLVLADLDPDTEYHYQVRSVNGNTTSDWSETRSFTTHTATGAEEPDHLPEDVELEQNYPNPFNPATTIEYNLPEDTDVTLEVLSMEGRHITTLVNEEQSAGSHRVSFDASSLASGVYMYRLEAGDVVKTQTMTFVK